MVKKQTLNLIKFRQAITLVDNANLIYFTNAVIFQLHYLLTVQINSFKMSNMKNKPTKLATTAFLILIYSTVEMPSYLKYSMLAIATISFIITVVQLYEEHKSKEIPSKAKK